MTTHRLHRPRHHGQPDGRPPAGGRPRRRRLQPARPTRTKPLVEAGGRAAASIAEAVKDADVVAVMVPDSPRRRRTCSPARTASSTTRQAGHAGHRLLQHPPRRDGRARARRPGTRASGCSTRRSPVARPAPRTPRCRSWSAATAADFEEAKPVFDAVGKTIVHVGPQRRRARRSRPPTSSSSPPTSRRSPRPWSFLEAYGVDPRPRSTCSAAGSPARRCSTRSAPTWLRHDVRRRASGSTCTTRTWASSPPPRARPVSSYRSARSSPS